MTTHVLDELIWRGLLVQHTDIAALRAALDAGPVTYYCGFDPTAPSLHLGHLVQLLTMRRLQRAGHRPLALVGGATGLIGDPRMSGERTLNDKDTVANWSEALRGQIEGYLDFEGQFAAKMVNNLDWIAPISAIDFLRDIGKHYRLGTMLAKETVARRLNSDQGISFTEFSYQILQGLDFLELYRRYGCTLQTGGNDQWGNLLSGVELIRRTEQTAVHAMTTPLITKADGTKFGKSEDGAISLDPTLTSPFAFYQFWLNTDDRDVMGYLKVFTDRSAPELEELEEQTQQRPQARAAQRALAEDVTALVHGSQTLADVKAVSQALFGRGELAALDSQTLADAAAEVPSAVVAGEEHGVVDLLVATGLAPSKGAARRTITDGGVSTNNEIVTDLDHVVRRGELLHGRWLVLRRGRRAVAMVDFRR